MNIVYHSLSLSQYIPKYLSLHLSLSIYKTIKLSLSLLRIYYRWIRLSISGTVMTLSLFFSHDHTLFVLFSCVVNFRFPNTYEIICIHVLSTRVPDCTPQTPWASSPTLQREKNLTQLTSTLYKSALDHGTAFVHTLKKKKPIYCSFWNLGLIIMHLHSNHPKHGNPISPGFLWMPSKRPFTNTHTHTPTCTYIPVHLNTKNFCNFGWLMVMGLSF